MPVQVCHYAPNFTARYQYHASLHRDHARQAVSAIPDDGDPGNVALVNAKRAAFIVDLLGHAVGDECVSYLTHVLDHVHYDVMEYLGETDPQD